MKDDTTHVHRWRRLLAATFGVLCLPALGLWVHLTIGWPTLLAPWADLSLTDGAVLLVGIIVAYLARAVRLYDYFHPIASGAPLAMLRLSLLHNLANNLLPMRTGEAALPLLMKRYFATSYLRSGISLLCLRVLDLAALVLLASTVIASGEHFGPGQRRLALLLAIASASGLLLLPWLVHQLPNDAHGARLARWTHTIADSLPAAGTGAYARAVAYTVVAWASKGLAFLWLVLVFTPLTPATAALGVAAGELSSVLPLHGLAGSGTYEAAMVGALVAAGADHDIALVAAVNVHLLLLGAAVLLGAGALALPRPPSSRNADQVSSGL